MTACATHSRERAALYDDPRWRLSYGPGGYVSGESSAVARFVHSGVALPLFSSKPLAHAGPSGRPTVVSNAETAAQVSAVLRLGPTRWRGLGAGDSAGPALVTVTGAVSAPGAVYEVVGRVTIGEVLRRAGVEDPPQAVLVGGYAGTWLLGAAAWDLPWAPAALGRWGAAPGCGLLAVLPHGACGLRETERVVRYLSGESAGQCGPCVHGLPLLAKGLADLHQRTIGVRSARRRLHRISTAVEGSGACRHPDGVARLVRSALETFDHGPAGRHDRAACAASRAWFPLPGSWRPT